LVQAGLTRFATATFEGGDLDRRLEAVVAARPDLVIVLGGDGTIRTVAERCGSTGIKMLPLPGGTMNMLVKALVGDHSWQDILARTLRHPKEIEVPAGEVEGHRFFCAGIFGAPALWADAREAVRRWDIARALAHARHAYRRAFASRLSYDFGQGVEGSATAIATICPLISRAMPAESGALESAVFRIGNISDAAHIAWTSLSDDWRADSNVQATPSVRVEIHARAPIPAILDGERFSLGRNAVIRFEPEGFVALAPGG
jgi:diacylglycerol kinase family enzyme